MDLGIIFWVVISTRSRCALVVKALDWVQVLLLPMSGTEVNRKGIPSKLNKKSPTLLVGLCQCL